MNKDKLIDESIVMLKVFKACMETQVLPAKDSPCWDKVCELIDEEKEDLDIDATLSVDE